MFVYHPPMLATEPNTALIEAARALAPRVRDAADQIERERRLPDALVRALAEAGFFRMTVPRRFGGGEVDPLTRMLVLEELARADASTAWVVETGSATAQLAGGWLREDAARTVLCTDPNVVIGGAIGVAKGRATLVPGGYRLSGRWPWGSGCRHQGWLAGASVILDGETPRTRADGAPEVRILVFPADAVEIIDTWTSTGLRGSGSHDYAVQDLFVPEEYSFSLAGTPRQEIPLIRLRASYLPGPPALALGVARAALEALVELAGAKVANRDTRPLRERSMVQVAVAQAEALIGAARAYLYDTVDRVWQTVLAGEAVSPHERAIFRLASTNAMQSAVGAVDLIYSAGGGSSVLAAGPLDRPFRDIHTMAQHAAWAPFTLEPAGRMLLGLEPDAALF